MPELTVRFSALRVRFALSRTGVRPLASDVDRRSIDHVLDVRGVEFLDHLDAGATVLGDLIDVCTLHEPEADIGVPEAVSRARVAFAVLFQAFLA